MKLEFLGAAHEVTGSCHFLQVGDKNILIDCGMEQGPDIYENQDLPVNAAEIDYVFVTHAHIDHSGLIPLLYVHGFRGQVFATQATTQLCNIMLRDSAHIQEQEAEWKNRKARRAGNAEVVPMYTVNDAQAVMKHFVPCPYGQKIAVCEGVTIRFRDAGHLLGSSFIEVWAEETIEGDSASEKKPAVREQRKLIFSGDLGHGNRPLIRDPEIPEDADYLIIESTYGDRFHEVPPDYAEELAKLLSRTFARGGNLVIPAFSVGRTQEMLYHLKKIKTRGLLPEFQDFTVFVDSPMAVEATNIFNENELTCFREEAKAEIENGENPIQFAGLRKSVTSDESKMINFEKKPVVIISASGMCEAGRIRHHLKHNLWRPECTVLFVGYQVPGTLGNKLLNGVKEVKLFGEAVQVKAEIVNLPGISGHADRNHLTKWVSGMKQLPQKVFVVHGEDQVTDEFANHLSQTLGVDAVAPYSGDVYDLLSNRCVQIGTIKPAKKKTKAPTGVFARLIAAAEHLLAVAKKCEGRPNKELGQFADQINSLCDKWEK